MESTGHLQIAAAAFNVKLNEAKQSLGTQDFEWYPHDTFGSTRPLDAFLPNGVELLKKLAGNLPVLEVGGGDGQLSFFLESLGCTVDAVDYPPANPNGMRGIRVLKEALGSGVNIHTLDVDATTALPRPLYGLTLFMGVLYHVRNPFHVLELLAEHSQFCLLSTRIARRTPRGAPMAEEALAYLVADEELNGDRSNYWIFSETGLQRLLERAGWKVRGLVKAGNTKNSNPVRPDRDERATCLVESRRIPRRDAPRLVEGWHERQDVWHWTAREFAVEITRHPLESPRRLEFCFFLNQAVADALGTVTLRARMGGRDLETRIFEGAGEHVYSATIPVDIWDGLLEDNLRIDFSLDRGYQPPPPNRRELGLQVIFEKVGSLPTNGNSPTLSA